MTLTLELTEEEEARLESRTRAAGMSDPAQYLRSLIGDKPNDAPPHKDMEAHLRAEGIIGAFKGKHDVGETSSPTPAQLSKFEGKTGEEIIEHLRAIGVIGAVEGTPREDGRPWSEIEAACDPS